MPSTNSEAFQTECGCVVSTKQMLQGGTSNVHIYSPCDKPRWTTQTVEGTHRGDNCWFSANEVKRGAGYYPIGRRLEPFDPLAYALEERFGS